MDPTAPAETPPAGDEIPSAYSHYWRRKQLLAGPIPHFPARRWWLSDDLCDSERIIFDAIRGAGSLLDVGAGNLRVMRKVQAAGYRGEYLTQDVGTEFAYSYRDLAEIDRAFDAILCLDVIEHLRLDDGLTLLATLAGLLAPGGVLVLQTPNARCIRQPLGWDMTHLHVYNITDLWAHLTCLGLIVEGYRVAFVPSRPTLIQRALMLLSRYVTIRLLGCDFADNLLVIARKPA